MKRLNRTIGIVGICQILLWSLPAVALTVGDQSRFLQTQESTHIEDVVSDTIPSDSIRTGELICTENNEECIVKQPESGESGTIESQPAVVSIYQELSKTENLAVPESTPEMPPEQIPEPEAEASVDAPVETIVKVIYIQAPSPSPGTTTAPETPEVSGKEEAGIINELPLAPLVEDVLIEVVDQLGINDFGLSNVLSGNIIPQKEDSTGTWIIYWCLVGVISYSATMFLFRKAWMEKSRQEVEYALTSKRRSRRLRKSR